MGVMVPRWADPPLRGCNDFAGVLDATSTALIRFPSPFLRVGFGPGIGRSVGLPRLLTFSNLNGVSGSQGDLIFASVSLEPTAVYK